MEQKDENRPDLLEIYKLHAELAQQSATQRDNLTKLYSGMVISILAAAVLLYRFAPAPVTWWVLALPILGIVVTLVWFTSMRSATGHLSAKHDILVELECHLPFDFLTREEVAFNRIRALRRKSGGTVIQLTFFVTCTIWLFALVIEIISKTTASP